MKTFKLLAILAALQCLPAFLFAQNGSALFWQNCASCHTIGKGKLVGPDLKGISEKRSRDWLYQWIKSPAALVKTGDTAAVKLVNDNNKVIMTDQDLEKDQVTAILAYLDTQSAKVMVVATANMTDSTPAAVNNGVSPLVMSGTPAVFNKDMAAQASGGNSWEAWEWWALIIIVALIINISTSVAFESVADTNHYKL